MLARTGEANGSRGGGGGQVPAGRLATMDMGWTHR